MIVDFISLECKGLFEGDYLVAHVAENLVEFAESEIKEDDLLNILQRMNYALCDGVYLASIMKQYEHIPEAEQIDAVDYVFCKIELACRILKKMDGERINKLTEMVRCGDLPFPCLLDMIFRNKKKYYVIKITK